MGPIEKCESLIDAIVTVEPVVVTPVLNPRTFIST